MLLFVTIPWWRDLVAKKTNFKYRNKNQINVFTDLQSRAAEDDKNGSPQERHFRIHA